MLSGDNGILQRATDAKTRTDEAQIRERIQLAYHSALTGGQGSYTKESLEDELKKEFGENNYNVNDESDTEWRLSAKVQEKEQSVTIPAGEKNKSDEDEIDLSIDTTWQEALEFPNYNYNRYVLDEENKILTLRSGPSITAESVEIKKYAVIDGVKYDTKFLDSCSGLFRGCQMQSIVIASDIDTSNVTNTSSMFEGCNELANFSAPNLVNENVSDMNKMFYSCHSLTVFDAPNWNTSGVTNMSGMFAMSEHLTSFNAPNWDTSSVTNMSTMFNGCYALSNINIANWDTSSVTNMGSMFSGCYSVVSLDLSNWDTKNVTDMSMMFEVGTYNDYTSHLRTIIVSDKFVTTKVSNMTNIFSGSYSTLVGGNGTTGKYFSDNHNYDEKLAASIDTAVYDESGNLVSGTPGFFTAK